MSHYVLYPKYKDSGVVWIGKIPEHWKMSTVKREFNAQLGKMVQPEQKTESDQLVPYHKAISVQWDKVSDDPPDHMWASEAEISKFSIEKGDLLICEGGDVGRAAIYQGSDVKPIIIQNSLHRVRPLKGNKCELLLGLMRVVKGSGWMDVLCNKSTIVHFTSEKLGNLEFPVAPPEEQEVMVQTISRETARIDSLIDKTYRSISLLKERRSAFITAAVTGQIDLREQSK